MKECYLNENNNYFKLELEAKNINESFARGVVAMFAGQLSPTVSEISDIKTAVSEAVTNSIVHGYGGKGGKIILEAKRVLKDNGEIIITEWEPSCNLYKKILFAPIHYLEPKTYRNFIKMDLHSYFEKYGLKTEFIGHPIFDN